MILDLHPQIRIEKLTVGAEQAPLLVIDNFEHVGQAASLVAEMLAQARSIKVLVTSRSPLRLRGEWELPVAPLPVPELDRIPLLDKRAIASIIRNRPFSNFAAFAGAPWIRGAQAAWVLTNYLRNTGAWPARPT